MPVIETLRAKEGFTASESELADYILEHADEVSHMGIAELAAASYKSNATIIRLCRKAGSSGWRNFRVDLVADLESGRNATHDVDPNMPFSQSQSTASIMSSVMQLEREAITDCYVSVQREAIGNFARATTKCRRIIYYALGDSYTTLYSFGGLMSKIGVECVAADQYRFGHEAAFHAHNDDLALIVSYSGTYIPQLKTQIERLRSRRCKIAIITSETRVLEAHPYVDFPILVPKRENKYGKVATFYSQTCIRYVLNCIYSVAFAQDYEAFLHNKDEIEKVGSGYERHRHEEIYKELLG